MRSKKLILEFYFVTKMVQYIIGHLFACAHHSLSSCLPSGCARDLLLPNLPGVQQGRQDEYRGALAKMSMHLGDNILFKMMYGANKFGITLATPTDMMHASESGVIKYINKVFVASMPLSVHMKASLPRPFFQEPTLMVVLAASQCYCHITGQE